jgi:hypothetical protein
VPSFTETSSPELDKIFATFRQKVFLPAHLSKAQRDLVFKTKHMRMVAADPITVSVGGENFQLEHIDNRVDVPNSRKGFFRALHLMQDKRDWDNLPRFLSGLHQARRGPAKMQQFMMIRKAAEAGRLDVIIECARRVSETGFELKDPILVNTIVANIQNIAMVSNWDVKETKRALTWVEMVSVMLEDERHAGGRKVANNDDPRVSPELIGVLLELSAVRAARHLGGKDEHGKVDDYAGRLLSRPLDLEPAEKSPDNTKDAHVANHWLSSVIPIVHGMKVARTVLDPASETTAKLKAKELELENLISQEREYVINSKLETSFRGLALYDKLLAERSA